MPICGTATLMDSAQFVWYYIGVVDAVLHTIQSQQYRDASFLGMNVWFAPLSFCHSLAEEMFVEPRTICPLLASLHRMLEMHPTTSRLPAFNDHLSLLTDLLSSRQYCLFPCSFHGVFLFVFLYHVYQSCLSTLYLYPL